MGRFWGVFRKCDTLHHDMGEIGRRGVDRSGGGVSFFETRKRKTCEIWGNKGVSVGLTSGAFSAKFGPSGETIRQIRKICAKPIQSSSITLPSSLWWGSDFAARCRGSKNFVFLSFTLLNGIENANDFTVKAFEYVWNDIRWIRKGL